LIDERGQTELGADIVEALDQKGTPWFIHCLIEPILDVRDSPT